MNMFGIEYYPTPANIVNKMLLGIDFRSIKSVLEPSSGDGNIAEVVKQKIETYQSSRYNQVKADIDCIEIDQDLTNILKGKGFRVVYDDFMQYHTAKIYDLIVMNPPFSVGDKHVLKAIELLENNNGGCLRAIVNAETIRNTCTNSRIDLIEKIEKYKGEVEYIQNAFSDAERQTSVEIALIKITIPRSNRKSIILDKLKQEETQDKATENRNNQIIHGDYIVGIVEQYKAEVAAGIKLIKEYYALLPMMLKSFKNENDCILRLEINRNNIGYTQSNENDLINEYIKTLRFKYWSALFNSDQFTGMLTTKLKNEYQSKINDLCDYDFSIYNICQIKADMTQGVVHGVEDTIIGLFEEFTTKYHHNPEYSKNRYLYDGWKSNTAYKVNKRVIIPLNGYHWYDKDRLDYSHKVIDKLKDIEKAMNYLDGGLTEDHADLTETLKLAEEYGETKKIQLKFFTITFFKKGTCHIEFDDEDLLKKFNIFAGQKFGWLPPSYGKAKYEDMTTEEKQVIKSFEGEESYKKTMSNTGYYLFNANNALLGIAG